ncbi:type IV pilus assembly protein PilV [Gammaproteobacteria bacterium]
MKKQNGFTLLEVLIAMVVLSVGLLAMASLQIMAWRSNLGALLRSQATNLSYFIIDSMRVNQQAAINGNYNNTLTPLPTCNASADNPLALTGTIAEQDVAAWRNMLACTLPQGTGSVTVNGNTVTITVQWNTSHDGSLTMAPFTMVTNL